MQTLSKVVVACLFEHVEFSELLTDVDLPYFHRGQPQNRELHALFFSNSVRVL